QAPFVPDKLTHGTLIVFYRLQISITVIGSDAGACADRLYHIIRGKALTTRRRWSPSLVCGLGKSEVNVGHPQARCDVILARYRRGIQIDILPEQLAQVITCTCRGFYSVQTVVCRTIRTRIDVAVVYPCGAAVEQDIAA